MSPLIEVFWSFLTQAFAQIYRSRIQAAMTVCERIFNLIDAKAVRYIIEEVIARWITVATNASIIDTLVIEQLHRSD